MSRIRLKKKAVNIVTAAGKSTPVLSAHAYINWIGLKSGSDVKIRCSVQAQAQLLLSDCVGLRFSPRHTLESTVPLSSISIDLSFFLL